MHRVVVVGGLGFIGSEIVRALVAAGDEVLVLDRTASTGRVAAAFPRSDVRAIAGDIRDPHALAMAFAGADEVYHLAGALGTTELDACVREAVDANVVGAVNVFDAALRAGVGRVFMASKPDVWLNTYTVTKRTAEQLALIYAERHGLRVSMLRYFNAYGPGQKLVPVRKIVPTFAAQALRGVPLTVFGDGEQTVDMIYAPDLARLTVRAVRGGLAGPPADCGRGVALTVNEVAHAVNAHFGSRAGVRHVPMRTGEDPRTQLVADATRLRVLLGDLALSSWEASLASTLDWYARLDDDVIAHAVAAHAA